MMQITQNQIKALIDEQGNARKCLKCQNRQVVAQFNMNRSFKRMITCPDCQGTGKATISIPKEWVVCNCGGKGCTECYGKGKRLKYEVGEEIYYCLNNPPCDCLGGCNNKIRLKIISETEDKWRVCLI
mgnify:CR=1 FL=1